MVKSGNPASGSGEKGLVQMREKGLVQMRRHTCGRRMSEEKFNSLSKKEQERVLRNRRNALQTRARRKKRIEELKKENALLKARIELKYRQTVALRSLLGDESPTELLSPPPPPPPPPPPLPHLDITPESLNMLPEMASDEEPS